MKRFCYISLIFFAVAASLQAQDESQRTPRMSRGGDRARQQQAESNAGLPELTVRAQNMNEQLTQDVGNARWMRVVYREIDLTKEKNGPLYYPVQESNGAMNLFTTIFHHVSEGKINVYNYTADYEDFSEDNLLTFKDFLDKFSILYEEVPAGGGKPARYVINSSDIPSSEVKTYYVKEVWYFDQSNSIYDVKTLAICPIAFLISDFGEQRTPMFWVKYEDLRPYISNKYIMTSNMNNAKTFTIDDYFRRRMFDGEIVKTENLMNLPLQAYCPTPDSLKSEQKKIEAQLVAFNDSLWIKPDTATVVLDKKAAKKLRASKKKSGTATANNKASSTKEKKAAEAKSAPTRSIRRR